MLINLSNHPYDKWPEDQKSAAIELYHNVTDIPFPNIDPWLTTSEVDELTEQYLDLISAYDDVTVHIMGELVFTFLMVDRLREVGIPCIASTTERLVEVEGETKRVTFQFCQFRPYFIESDPPHISRFDFIT